MWVLYCRLVIVCACSWVSELILSYPYHGFCPDERGLLPCRRTSSATIRLNHSGEATVFSRADPITSIPGISPGITVHGHCLEQGLPEPASETEIGPCNYHREGATFVDSIENYLSKGTHLSPAKPETFQAMFYLQYQ